MVKQQQSQILTLQQETFSGKSMCVTSRTILPAPLIFNF